MTATALVWLGDVPAGVASGWWDQEHRHDGGTLSSSCRAQR